MDGLQKGANEGPRWVCAMPRRRFPVSEKTTRQFCSSRKQ